MLRLRPMKVIIYCASEFIAEIRISGRPNDSLVSVASLVIIFPRGVVENQLRRWSAWLGDR